MHLSEVRPRKDKRGVDLISDALPFGWLWYAGPYAISNAIGYAEHRSRSHHTVIRVYYDPGNVIETHEQAGDFKAPQRRVSLETRNAIIVGLSYSFLLFLTTFLKFRCR